MERTELVSYYQKRLQEAEEGIGKNALQDILTGLLAHPRSIVELIAFARQRMHAASLETGKVLYAEFADLAMHLPPYVPCAQCTGGLYEEQRAVPTTVDPTTGMVTYLCIQHWLENPVELETAN